LVYCDSKPDRQKLIDDFEWDITGDTECETISCIPLGLDGDTNVPANFNLTWEELDIAEGYVINVRKEVGGMSTVIVNNLTVGQVGEYDFPIDFNPGDVVFASVAPFNATTPAPTCAEERFVIVTPWSQTTTSFKTTWDTRNTGPATNNQILIETPTRSAFTYDYSIEWGDGRFDNNVTGSIIHTYTTPGIYTVSIIGQFPAIINSRSPDNRKILTIDQWGTIEWESMNRAFEDCKMLTYAAIDVPDLSKVTDMSLMFNDAELFNGNLDSWDVSNVTNMSGVGM